MMVVGTSGGECGSCNLSNKWVLHNVRHRGIYKRLCTSCVLILHPGLFCPICFEFYDPPLSSHLRALCQKCSSISHNHCLPSPSDSSFVCPPCLNPTFSFFDLPRQPQPQSPARRIDLNASKVLVCALRIASLSMKKAVLATRGEAERRLKEAAFARKRARESLSGVESTAAKDKDKTKITTSQGYCIPGAPAPDRNGLDHSSDLSANHHLEDKDRITGLIRGANGVSTTTTTTTSAEDKERPRPSLQNNVTLSDKDRSGTLAHYNALEEKANKTAPFVLQGRNGSH